MSNVSWRAAALHEDALVWDMVFVYEPNLENDYRLFPRWQAAGVNFLSVHPAGDRHNVGDDAEDCPLPPPRAERSGPVRARQHGRRYPHGEK